MKRLLYEIKDYLELILSLIYSYKHRYIPNTFQSKFYISNYHKVSNPKTKKCIIFMIDGKIYHGVLTDRLKGLLSTYYIARSNNYDFYVYWNSPFRLDTFLVPNSAIDYRINADEISYGVSSFPALSNLLPKKYKLKNTLRKWTYINLLRINNKYMQIHCYTNHDFAYNHFPLLYKELFKPSPLLQRELNKHLSIIGKSYYSYSFRFTNLLGDFPDIVGTPLSVEEKNSLIKKNIEELKVLLKRLPVGFKAFVTSDSAYFLRCVKSIDDRIYVVTGNISHIANDIGNGNDMQSWLKIFVDQHIIMNAKKVFLLKTGAMYNSGFPKFAALIGGAPYKIHQF